MRKTTLDKLDEAIAAELKDYSSTLSDGFRQAVTNVVKAGAAAVRSGARSKFRTKAYARGWTYKITSKRLVNEGVIYNKTEYRVSHLLERDHAVKRGGRQVGTYHGRPHIEPVEKRINQQFEQKVRAVI
jgi:hypothetical protein